MASESVRKSGVAEDVIGRVDKLHLDFKVLSRETTSNGSMYIVAVPKVIMRSGFFGWISHAATDTWGKPTKLGRTLQSRLNSMDRVECGIDNDVPHLLFVHVDAERPDTSPADFPREMTRGLPHDILVLIEEIVLMNNGPIQRVAEWFRRLF